MKATSGISNYSCITVQLQNREYLGQHHETFTLKCGEQRSSDPWTSIKCQMLRPLISCFISGYSCEYPHKCKRSQFQAHTAGSPQSEPRVNPPAVLPEAAELHSLLELGTPVPAVTRTKQHHTGHRQSNASHQVSSCSLWGHSFTNLFTPHKHAPLCLSRSVLETFHLPVQTKALTLCSDKADSTQAEAVQTLMC